MKGKLILVTLGAIAIAGVAGASIYTPKSVKSGLRHTFETREASVGSVTKIVATSGTVRPVTTVQIGSELSGRIKSVSADFNAKVKPGDLLALIDPVTFKSRANQAQADLEAANASLQNYTATLRKAKAVLNSAERALDRQQKLDSRGVSAAALVDNARRDRDVALAEIDVAEANIENAKAMIAQKKAQLEQALIDMQRTEIRAPIGGIVLSRTVEVGQTVAASFQAPELFKLAGDLTRMHIEAQVSEADIGYVKPGNAVTFDVDAFPGRAFSGKVEQVRLSPDVSDNVVTYTVIIEAKNESLALYPGMTANVKIETAKRDDVMRVSAEAIRFKPPREYVVAEEKDEEEGKSKDRVASLVHRWSRRLAMTAEQVAALEKAVAPLQAAADDGDKGKKKSVSKLFKRSLMAVLTEEQREKYEALEKERKTTTRASVWVLGDDGRPDERKIRIGLVDSKFAEIIGKDIKTGDKVIVRSRSIAQN